MRVKVCGIRNESDLQSVAEGGVDAVGFIVDVSVDTHREITPEDAARLCNNTPPFITTVLVTMPRDTEHLLQLIEEIRPDAVQIHHLMPREQLAELAGAPVRVIQYVPADENALETINEIKEFVDAILLDTPGTPGGGVTHDWEMSARITEQADLPVILAGGLGPGNVEEAIGRVGPYGVDAATGVEINGYKDPDKTREFVRRAKQCK